MLISKCRPTNKKYFGQAISKCLAERKCLAGILQGCGRVMHYAARRDNIATGATRVEVYDTNPAQFGIENDVSNFTSQFCFVTNAVTSKYILCIIEFKFSSRNANFKRHFRIEMLFTDLFGILT